MNKIQIQFFTFNKRYLLEGVPECMCSASQIFCKMFCCGFEKVSLEYIKIYDIFYLHFLSAISYCDFRV